jgi:hypothetical protein
VGSLFLLNIYYPIFGYFGYDAKRNVQVTFVLCIHIALLDRSVSSVYLQQFSRFTLVVKSLLLVLVGFSFLSSFFAMNYLYGFGDWLHFFLLLNTAFIIAAISFILPWARLIFLGALFTGFVWLLLAFLFFCVFTLILGEQAISPWEAYPNVANIRFLNQVHIQLFFFFPVFYMLVQIRYRFAVLCMGMISAYMLIIGYG